MWEKVDQRVRHLLGKIRLPFRGVIQMVRSDVPVQLVQGEGMAGEQIQDAELFQHYGFTSNPPSGAMKVVLPIGGRTSHGIVVATEHASYRIQGLAPGELAIYTDEGDSVVMNRGRIINVTTQTLNINASQAVNINTQTFKVSASDSADFTTPMLSASEQVTAQGQINGNGGMAIQGGDGASFEGDVTQTSGNYTTSGDVVASGTSLHGHKHPGDSGGITGSPI